MFKNYFKTAWRNLKNDKVYSSINTAKNRTTTVSKPNTIMRSFFLNTCFPITLRIGTYFTIKVNLTNEKFKKFNRFHKFKVKIHIALFELLEPLKP